MLGAWGRKSILVLATFAPVHAVAAYSVYLGPAGADYVPKIDGHVGEIGRVYFPAYTIVWKVGGGAEIRSAEPTAEQAAFIAEVRKAPAIQLIPVAFPDYDRKTKRYRVDGMDAVLSDPRWGLWAAKTLVALARRDGHRSLYVFSGDYSLLLDYPAWFGVYCAEARRLKVSPGAVLGWRVVGKPEEELQKKIVAAQESVAAKADRVLGLFPQRPDGYGGPYFKAMMEPSPDLSAYETLNGGVVGKLPKDRTEIGLMLGGTVETLEADVSTGVRPLKRKEWKMLERDVPKYAGTMRAPVSQDEYDRVHAEREWYSIYWAADLVKAKHEAIQKGYAGICLAWVGDEQEGSWAP